MSKNRNKRRKNQHPLQVQIINPPIPNEKSKWRVKYGIILSIGTAIAWAVSFFHPLAISYVEGKFFGGLSLYLHSERLQQDEPTYIFFSAPPKIEGSSVLLPIETSVSNDSRQPEKNVTLSIRYPKQGKREEIPEQFIIHSGSMQATDISHEVNSNADYTNSNYRIAFLPPEDRVLLSDASFVIPLQQDNNLPFSFAPPQGMDVDFTIYSESRKPQEWQVRYRQVPANNIGEITSWVERRYGGHIARELREELGFWRYLYRWAISKKTVVYFFSPKFNQVENTTLFVPNGFPKEYKAMKFSPYATELLFGS